MLSRIFQLLLAACLVTSSVWAANVLTRHGYEAAVQGKNGWVCWVGRGWMAMFDHPESGSLEN